MKFVKAQNNGNDFLITCEDIFPEDILFISDRRYGIGFDQLISVQRGPAEIYSVSFFNQDGSYAKMCGNGLLATTLFIKKFLENNRNEFQLKVEKTIYKTTIRNNIVSVKLPLPQIIKHIDEKTTLISTGNMHIVHKVKNFLEATEKLAEDFQKTYKDCNIHFLKQIANNTIRLKTFERGVGWTKACGSGAIASAFSTGIKGKISIVHDGGTSEVFVENDNVLFKSVPVIVFKGETL